MMLILKNSAMNICLLHSAGGMVIRAGPGIIFQSTSSMMTGCKALNYQGNWRDIFQNWEARLQLP
jgi:hypothetical protein